MVQCQDIGNILNNKNMAIWQYTFLVIPNDYLQETLNSERIEDEFDDSKFWENSKITSDFFSSVGSILKKTDSWSKNIICYGNIESNCFEIFCKNNFVISVSFRIDFTSEYRLLLNELIEFLILKGLSVLDETLDIVPLNYEMFKSIIENSIQVEKYNKLSET
jgi:hypothetical protein